MDVKLVQLSKFGHEEHPVEGKECLIGREPSCHLRLDHGKISLRHCRLFWRAGRLMVEDLNSSSGTSLNDEDLGAAAAELKDGDDLRVGPVHFLVRITSQPEASGQLSQDWLATNLQAHDGAREAVSPSDSNIVSPLAQSAGQILSRISTEHEGAIDSEPESRPRSRRHGLEVSDSGGIALAKILDQAVIEDDEIGRIVRQLDQLIESGQPRIAVHLGNVEHFSSQALGALLKASRRCQDSGGALKICKVRPAVAELFDMTNLRDKIEIYPDEGPALESLWPAPRPTEGPAEAPSTAAKTASKSPVARPTTRATKSPSQGQPCVRLIVEVGRAKGKLIEVAGSRFIIGRDRRCHLRPNSDTISRVHAIIEQKDGRVTVRDYGTKNGTILNGRCLRGEEAEVADGDRLQVGILEFSFQILPCTSLPPTSVEDEMASWLLGQDSTDADSPTELLLPTVLAEAATVPGPSSEPPPAAPTPKPPPEPSGLLAEPVPQGELKHEVIHGVLVLTIPQGQLDDETTVGPFRHNLHSLLDHPLPRKVVLDLENIQYLSSRAVGVILAYFQRLHREGGSLRVCCVNPKILPLLDQMRLPNLIDMYPSVEEAVSDPWI